MGAGRQQRGYGRWAFLEITDPWDAKNTNAGEGKEAMSNIRYDEIGYWSEIKLDIVPQYCARRTPPFCRRKRGFAGTST